MKTMLLCLLNTALMVAGQVLFKLGSHGKELGSLMDMIKLLFSPIVLVALCLYGATTMLWLYILSKTDISFAYPIQALAFPVVLILSSLIFHETVGINRWIGVLVIVAGVYITVYK